MRALKLCATPALILALGGCSTSGSGRDVNAVVQDERARQAVAQAAAEGEGAKAALAVASEAREAAADPPYRP